MRLKKVLSVMLVAAFVVSVTACGKKEEKQDAASGSAVSAGAADAAEAEATPDPDEGNLIKNGNFEGDENKWGVFQMAGGSGSCGINNGELEIGISDIGDEQHSVQAFYDGFQLNEGAEYKYSFDARSTIPRKVCTRLQINGGDYHAYYETELELKEEMQHYEYTFKMEEQSDPAPRLVFNCGNSGKEKKVDTHNVYIDNIRLELTDDSNVVQAEAVDPSGIRVNQLGFLPNATKTAVFAEVSLDEDSYKIVDKSGKEVYTGTLGAVTDDAGAGEKNRVADFSDFTTPGTYKLVAADGTESFEFEIADDVYEKVTKSAVKMLYLQRCGTALDKKYAGKYAHKKCHSEKAHLYWEREETVDVSGGWHDAGDYGRYVVAGAKAAADLILAYDNYSKKKIVDNVGTPYSGDGVDDLLQEAKYELDWLLKMQTKDGKVYHKVTCANFPETIMPEKEKDELILSYTSTPAAGDFVGVMALAARVYKASGVPAFKKAAKKYLKAAKKSWKYLVKNEKVKNYTNPSDIFTGEYPDKYDQDERFWAACEMYRTTKDKSIVSQIAKYSEEESYTRGLGWVEMGFYGCYAAMMNPDLMKADSATYEKITSRYEDIIAKTKSGVEANSYHVNRQEEYEWGSNLGIAGDGEAFLMADIIDGSNEHRKYAELQLNYLLGENATGYSFVTGYGDRAASNPHHRPSQFVGKAVPGMLVGGPDSALEDPYTQTTMEGVAPAKCYVDTDQSYSTNEVTIYWNSPLIFLLTVLQNS